MDYHRYRDPIHGFIEVTPLENKIINSPPFLRLRNIKQLAMTNLVYHGAEHTRFGHSLGVMHLVTKAFWAVIHKRIVDWPLEKQLWYEQILRLIALTHDLGHAPFSHSSEAVLPDNLKHEYFTERIIKETCIADYINEIGRECEIITGYGINPDLICDIYMGKTAGDNSEFIFLKSFMDSELDCDKMDYLLRDSLYCGVNYGKYDVDRLISCLTICLQEGIPRLAIEKGGVQAFEEFVLARYFMFVQVYFHRTRRYFDIIFANALKQILPYGSYPDSVEEYLQWDDIRVLQLIKDNIHLEYCYNIINRVVYSCILETIPHPQPGDKKHFEIRKKLLFDEFGKHNFIEDYSADKMPHKIPKKVEIEDEKAIIIIDKKQSSISTISDESYIIGKLSEKINIERVYVSGQIKEEAFEFIKQYS
ncbi:MAG TPA: phosphohydrolase [Clostridiales bacterium]|nr:phosphohydrolase [Clostridiales bacterium]